MLKKILCSAVLVIRRMNQWWDKDEDKEVASIVAGIIILLGILILKKPILFIIALIFIGNRVVHRFNLWTNWECNFSESQSSVLSKISLSENENGNKDFEIEEVEDEKE